MSILSLNAATLSIPFREVFRHAAAERAATQTLWVEAHGTRGDVGVGEGCPRDYVTRETEASALAFFAAHRAAWLAQVRDLPSLRQWVARHGKAIDANPAAWAAVELALLDLFAREAGCSVEHLLGLPELCGPFRYTAVLGDAPIRSFESQLGAYMSQGFRQFKLKLTGERVRDRAKVAALQRAGVEPQLVRADANNLWADVDTAILHLRELRYAFGAIEEPLAPRDVAGQRKLAQALSTRIVLDESVLRVADLDAYAEDAQRWIVNLRVSKMGGLLRSLNLLRVAREKGLKVIVGAHVGETSVLTRAALTAVNAARDLVIGQEGAFGTHLLARDVAAPSLRFGKGGVLDDAARNCAWEPGWGLTAQAHVPAVGMAIS